MSDAEDFAERVRKYRKREGISQEELAQRLGMSRNYVSMIEGGHEPSEQVKRHFDLLELSPLPVPASSSVQESEPGYETVKHVIYIEQHGTPEQKAAARAFLKTLREQLPPNTRDQSPGKSE